jgi:hypothetical protein
MPGGRIYHSSIEGGDWTPMAEVPYEAEEVTREVGIPDSEGGLGRWSLDHLFVDQEATPTLVEVKRSQDTRTRREVVGQMLDYAANVVAHWPAGSIRQLFDQRLRGRGEDPDEAVLAFLGLTDTENAEDGEVEAFWGRVDENLELRRMRLLFVADAIPRELQRIVEFMNETMGSLEVLAIEARQFLGEGHRVMVPRVIGNTAKAEERRQAGRSGGRRRWTLDEFRLALAELGGPEAIASLDEGIAWAESRGGAWDLGRGSKYGPLYLSIPAGSGSSVKIAALDAAGSLGIQYSELQHHPPFDGVEAR